MEYIGIAGKIFGCNQFFAALKRRQTCFNPQVPSPRSQTFPGWACPDKQQGRQHFPGILHCVLGRHVNRSPVHPNPFCSWRKLRVSPERQRSPPLQSTSSYRRKFSPVLFHVASQKQAPRMLIIIALEQLSVDDRALPYYRIYSWWVLVQSWGTLRFSDHRGLKPADITVKENSLVGAIEDDGR